MGRVSLGSNEDWVKNSSQYVARNVLNKHQLNYPVAQSWPVDSEWLDLTLATQVIWYLQKF